MHLVVHGCCSAGGVRVILTTLIHRVIALRNENKRLRHENRELKRQLATARQAVKMMSDKNWRLYNHCRTQPPKDCQVLEVPEC
jgi:regulator of replication initiation timing